ncbi:hypothetical protein LX36DRAFT_653637 [Colletotrichum falcatum]|nr:hypothetical protein LX36DRAFT_653637 [Colletotrichum falcatum]
MANPFSRRDVLSLVGSVCLSLVVPSIAGLLLSGFKVAWPAGVAREDYRGLVTMIVPNHNHGLPRVCP